ncbi:hypothetical protein ACIRO3_24950 [Streptomyces sp. NPDC102278]|uniref:hypothetical protein n=1 Tax=Streptomyces sp. NPDC102278 TaxID=3366152 RepID=UPI00381C92F6
MPITHEFDNGVLVIRLNDDLDISNRGAALWELEALLRGYRPRHLVMVVTAPLIGPAVLSTVLRAERRCQELGATLNVVAPEREARRLLRSPSRPLVHETVAEALETALESEERTDTAAA